MSVEELDKQIDEILSKAEEEKNKVIANARARAREIMSKPIPIEEYQREAEEIINRAKIEAEEIIKESKKKAEMIKNVGKEKIETAVALLLEYILGLRSE